MTDSLQQKVFLPNNHMKSKDRTNKSLGLLTKFCHGEFYQVSLASLSLMFPVVIFHPLIPTLPLDCKSLLVLVQVGIKSNICPPVEDLVTVFPIPIAMTP